MGAPKFTSETYFEELPKSTRDLVREALLDAIRCVEGWKLPTETIDDIECHSRSGFIPFSHNKGGLKARQFTDLSNLSGAGICVAHKGAQKEIERQIDYALKCARESFFEEYKNELALLKITKAEECSYHALYEYGQNKLAEDLSEYENEHLGGDENSIMFEVRFMYHGCDKGIHSASVSCAVNTEGPYHRSRISWAPDVFCEGAKEIEITWRTEKALERKLRATLKKLSHEVF